ncbi:MAG: major intrinsic protein [Candidatus Saccharibacteria bacterium]|nr:major intrinsic protein [Candidatus Saccharibacteria bacterium]
MFGRRKVAALVAEFLGTGVLTLVVLSVQRSTIGVPYFVAIAVGLTVAMITFVVGTVSGGYANPAITIALWTARKLSTLTAALYVVVQLLGAWAAYGVYTYFVNSSLQAIGGTYTGRVLVAEAIGAFIFALGWGYLTFRARVNVGTRAAVLGLAVTLGVIVSASVGIGLINPAVALGVRAWEIWGSMGWGTYVLGPVLGAVIGVNLYGLLFAGSDADEAVVFEEVVVAETVVAAPKRKATAVKKTTTKKSVAKKRSTKR